MFADQRYFGFRFIGRPFCFLSHSFFPPTTYGPFVTRTRGVRRHSELIFIKKSSKNNLLKNENFHFRPDFSVSATGIDQSDGARALQTSASQLVVRGLVSSGPTTSIYLDQWVYGSAYVGGGY